MDGSSNYYLSHDDYIQYRLWRATQSVLVIGFSELEDTSNQRPKWPCTGQIWPEFLCIMNRSYRGMHPILCEAVFVWYAYLLRLLHAGLLHFQHQPIGGGPLVAQEGQSSTVFSPWTLGSSTWLGRRQEIGIFGIRLSVLQCSAE